MSIRPLLLIATVGLMLMCTLPATARGGDDPFAAKSGSQALLGNQTEFLPVEQAYRPTASWQDGRLSVHWQIAEGYYLYRHRFAFATAGGDALTAQLPPGKGKDDEYFGHVEVYYHDVTATISAPPGQPFTLAATVQGCADAGLCYPPHTDYFRVDPAAGSVTPTAAPPKPSAQATSSPPAAPAAPAGLGRWLGVLAFAVLGGAILNLMPCVFPVLSLKVLSFSGSRNYHRGLHGLSYMAGVIGSFLLVAAVLLSLKAAGRAVGWGFQLQQPWFVGGLAYLFFAMGLSLSGFWEMGGQWMGAGSRLAAKSGYAGSFFTGVLATLVASPCTAPFMSSALGFAITQPPLLALSVFAALGFGMAAPVLLLALSPSLVRHLPKPGAWMDRFKQALAFPLYATTIWLVWIVGRQTGASGMALVLAGALALTLALWLWRFGLIARSAAAASLAVALTLLGSPLLMTASSHAEARTSAGSNWQPYRADTLAALRAAGKPVFLDITADWCITCMANEKVALDSDTVKAAFADHGITYLRGDWTNYDPAITALLSEFGRSGIPLYVFYPGQPGQSPVVLPQLLTPSLVADTVSGGKKSS